MAWSGKFRGKGIRGRRNEWAFAKTGRVSPYIGSIVAYSNNANGVGPGNNLRVTNGLVTQWWCTEGASTTLGDSTPPTFITNLNWDGSGGQWSQDAAQSDRWYLNLSGGGKADNLISSEIFNSVTGTSENGLTIEAWFKPTAAAGADNPGPGRILSFSNPSDPTHDINFMLGHGTFTGAGHANTNYHGRVKIGNSTTHIWSGDGVATTNLQHVVMTCEFLAADANNSDRAEVKMYVDNDLKSTVTVNVASPDLFYDWADAAKIALGSEHNNTRKANGGYYLGAIYDRALTSGEVGENYTEGVVSVSNAYISGGNTAYLYGEPDDIKGGETKTLTVGINGSRIGKVTCNLEASAPGMTEGVDFVLSTSTVVVPKFITGVDFTLSASPALSADVTIGVAITTATGSNTISNPGVNVDLVTIPAISKTIKPELKIVADSDPQHMIGGGGFGNLQAWRVAKSRSYSENIEFYFSGTQSGSNLADYYFLSGGSTGGFSAPYQPSPATTGPNNSVWQSINGAPISLSAYGGPDTIIADGTIIENASFSATLDIKASDVTVRNCSFDLYNISFDDFFENILKTHHSPLVDPEPSGLLIEDCFFRAWPGYTQPASNPQFPGDHDNHCTLGLKVHDATIRRCNFSEISSLGVRMFTKGTIESCYFSGIGLDFPQHGDDPHADGAQARETGPYIFRWNYFDMPQGDDANAGDGYVNSVALIVQAADGDIEGTIIDSNWFKGGGTAIMAKAKNQWTHDNIYILNNKFYPHDNYSNHLCDIGGNGTIGNTYRFGNVYLDGSPACANIGCTTSTKFPDGLIDNLTEPPVVPGYDTGVEVRVDFSAGKFFGLSPEEDSMTIPITCSAGATGGVFAADDSITGYIISGSVETGADAGDSLTVCSTLSSNEIIFDPPPLPGIGNNPFDEANVMTTPVNNPGVIQVGETSATTGPRSSTTDWVGAMPRYVDLGTASETYDIEVPPGGLTVSGHKFTSIKLETHNPIRFVDCQFSGQTDYHANVTPPALNYIVWDNNNSDQTLNGIVDFEYCDFRGGGGITLYSRFRRLYRCRFGHVKDDCIRFRTAPAYRVDNCWFGPNMNIEDDAALNGGNGQYSPGQFSPHSDYFQIYLSQVGTIAVNNCTFESRVSVWGDGTVNPDHHRGSSPNRIFMIGGSSSSMGDLRKLYWNNCIFHGSGNYLFGVKSQTLVQTPRDFYFTNCKMGTGTSSRYFSWGQGPTNTTVHATGNTWLETGTKYVKLPAVALAAGVTTNLGRDTLDANVLLDGTDYVNFGATGLNESGRTAWSKRSTPV